MFKREECFRVRGDIIALKTIDEDEVMYALQYKAIKSFSPSNCKTLKSLWLEYLSSQTTAIAFHPTEDLAALANGKTIYIVDTNTKAVLQTIISYAGVITILHFVKNSPYLISGTNNGRVVQYRYDGKSSLSRLCSFPFNNPIGKKVLGKNYVGAIDANEEYVVCSGYGGAITIIKLNSLTHKKTIQSARVRVNTLKLISNELLISASVDANIYFHDLKKYKSTKTISSPIGNITQIVPVTGTEYALLNAQSNKIALLSLTTKKIIASSFLSFDLDIKFLEVVNQTTLIIVFSNNSIEKITLPTEDDLEDLIVNNKLADAFLLPEINPMLQNSSQAKHLEALYNKTYERALDAFVSANKQEAINLLKPFEEVKSKHEEIQLLLASFELYQNFSTLVMEKKYSIAYAMSEKYPIFTKTHPYKRMEEEFNNIFSFAQKQIKLGRSDLAQEMLSVYATTNAKKAVVKLLLKRNKEFLIFLRSLQVKNYKNIAILTKQDKTYTQLPEYQKFLKELHNELLQIEKDIYSRKIDNAIKKIKELQYLPSIQEELKELYTIANYVKLFVECYKNDDFVACYETIDRSKDLENLELSQMLERHWSKLMDQCENFALQGDLKGIKTALSELITLKSRSAKIGDLLRLSFHTKIKQLLGKHTYAKAETIFYSYIDIFGLDTEIKSLMKMYEKLSKKKLAITANQELYKTRDAWRNSEFIVGDYKVKP